MVKVAPYGEIRRKSILFGDDLWGLVWGYKPPYKGKNGMWMVAYLIHPLPDLVRDYPILQKKGALTYKDFCIWAEYPQMWVHDTSPSQSNSIARVDCTYDGRETLLTRKSQRYTDEIRLLEVDLEIARSSLLYKEQEVRELHEELNAKIEKIVEINEMLKTIKGGSHYGNPEDENIQ